MKKNEFLDSVAETFLPVMGDGSVCITTGEVTTKLLVDRLGRKFLFCWTFQPEQIGRFLVKLLGGQIVWNRSSDILLERQTSH
jgi:hypothetical protein